MGIAAIAQGSRITSQRHWYNLCENRLGLAALIVAARGYAFRVGLSVLAGRGPAAAPVRPDVYRERRQSRWFSLGPTALLSLTSDFWPSLLAMPNSDQMVGEAAAVAEPSGPELTCR